MADYLPLMIFVSIGVVFWLWRQKKSRRQAVETKAARSLTPGHTPSAPEPPVLPPFIVGDKGYAAHVVGESYYQRQLQAVCGEYTYEGSAFEGAAFLVLDDLNPHDKNAVKVLIEGQQVGHLSRDVALLFRQSIAKSPLAGQSIFRCGAQVRGGWDRGNGDIGMYGVRLDLVFITKP